MPYTDAQKKATIKYNAKAYDRIELKVYKGQKSEWRAHAELHGESLNAFIVRAVNNQIDADNKAGQ